MIEVLKDIGILVGVPIVRSVAGWANAALEDGEISKFEWQQLCATVVRVGTLSVMGYFGLGALGVDNAALIGSVSAFFIDKVLNAMKKAK
jgi:hypothetical protein